MTAPSSAPSASHGPSPGPSERLPGGAGRRPPPPLSRIRPFRLARAWRAAAFLLAAALALPLGAETAEAQTSVKLVSNTGQTGGGHTTFNNRHQAFTTGNHAAGYVLTRVDLLARRTVDAPTYSVSIHADSSGSPGTSLGTLTNPASLPSAWGIAQFTVSGGGISLAANTTYFMRLTGGTGARARITTADGEDAGGLAGWDIADRNSLSDTSIMVAYYGYAVQNTAAGISNVTAAGRYLTVNLTGNRGGCPALRSWTVKVNGTAYRTTSTRCTKGRALELWLHEHTPQIYGGNTVTLSYDSTLADLSYPGTPPTVLGTKLTVGGSEVASFVDYPVINLRSGPAAATVNGKVLTLTFGQALDGSSVPPASAFQVSTFGADRGVLTATDVSLSGKTATLILSGSVPSHVQARVTYSYSATNPLRIAAGGGAYWGFIAGVTVRTPNTPPVVRKMTVGHSVRPENQYHVLTGWWDIDDLPPVERWSGLAVVLNEHVDANSMPPASAFTVTARPPGGGRAVTVSGTGTVRRQSAANTVYMRLAEPVARDAVVTVSYAKPSSNALRDLAGSELESFSGRSATNVDNGSGKPEAVSVEVVSDSGSDRTYGRDETIRVRVTYSGVVHVSGTPRLRLWMGRSHPQQSPARGGAYLSWADYESGSGTRALTFAYTVRELDRSDGIAVEGQLELNGGSIESWAFRGWEKTNPDLRFRFPDWRFYYDPNHAVDGSLGRTPLFSSAAVDGTALTVTFDETLDADSLPAPGAFYVTVNNARRSVASGGVAIDGATVTLTLTSAVVGSDTVKVRYTKPSRNPLQSASGSAVDTFADQEVTNNTLITLWSATLTVQSVPGVAGCSDSISGWECSSRLTNNSFTVGGTTYRVGQISLQEAIREGRNVIELVLVLDKAFPQNLTLHVGDDEFAVADATAAASGRALTWTNPGFDWMNNQQVQFRLTSGGSGTSSGPSGTTGEDGGEPASVTGVSVVSDAGADQTYGDGDKVEVRVTFDGPVEVTGTPRLKIDMDPADWGAKWASYDRGSGGTSLTFVHTVAEPNLSTQGIAVLANTLELNGGTIRAGDTDADLAHDGLGHDANHKVDWRTAGEESGPGGTVGDSGPASVTGVAVVSSPASGDTYLLGETIRVRATFDQPVQVTGTPRLSIDMDPAAWGTKRAAYEKGGGTATLDFVHTVAEPNFSTQGIAVLANTLALNGGAIRSADTHADAELGHGGLGHDASHKVDWRPSVSVADARANEGAGAKVAFEVSLSRAFTGTAHTVTVDYATADGTAKAGEDYTATSGTLTFAAGEKTKTVNVPVLDDAVDEGEETFSLRLSNVQGARAGDLEATGTIANDDPLQKMWLSRFGRTVAGHVTDAVSDRLGAPLSGAQVTVGGQRVDLAQVGDEKRLGEALTAVARALGASEQPAPEDGFGPGDGRAGTGAWPGAGLAARGTGWSDRTSVLPARSVTGRELLLGSAFHLAAKGEGGRPGLAAWGRVTAGGFDGEAPADGGSVRIDGSVTTGILGADAEWNRLLAGVAVSVSEGEGSFAQPGVDSGDIESTMTTVSPYARLMVNDRLSVWGLAGWGTGDMTVVQDARAAADGQPARPERISRTDLAMRLAALGGRGALMEADEDGGIDLGLKADAFWVETEAEAVSNEGDTTASVSRVRLALEGSRAFRMEGGGVLTPGVELGVRHDGGDAETGTGVELGGRVSWTDPETGLSVEARVRTLIAHEDSDYREWGASGSIRLAPDERGRGLSLSLSPTYGAASSGVERLWSARDARGLAPGHEFEPGQRLEGEVGYGMALFGDRFTGTPNVGFGLSESARDYRVGWRLNSAVRGDPGFEVNLDAARREAVNDNIAGAGAEPEHSLMLRGSIRW